MVSREKVLEKRLDDVRNVFTALVIGIAVTIPIAVFAQGVKPELLRAFLAYCLGLLLFLAVLYYRLKKLYEEYSRDPPMWPELGLAAIALVILGIIVLLIAAM